MRDPGLPVRPLRRVEYDRLVEHGVFEPGERVELIDGQLIVAEPQSAAHFTAIQLVARALAHAFGAGWFVRTQGPIALDDVSEPEPDVAVVPGEPRDYAARHPAHPVLVVEVALARYAFDRTYKASLYARAACPEYWILDLVARTLEVHRSPTPAPAAPYGWDYAAVDVLGAGDTVSPLAAGHASIAVLDLLP